MNYKSLSRMVDSMDWDDTKLFHQVLTDDPKVLKDIMDYGLRANDNGESNGVWFQKSTPFYGKHKGFILTLPFKDSIRDACGFSSYDWKNSSSILVAHNDVPIRLLTLEYGFYGKTRYAYLYGERGSRFDELTYEECAQWMEDMQYTLYPDLYAWLFGNELDPKIAELPNFSLENYLG